MQRYMKSSMPHLGVATPALRAACREVFARHPLAAFEPWRDTVLGLWRGATHREHRYGAIELTGDRRYRDYVETFKNGIGGGSGTTIEDCRVTDCAEDGIVLKNAQQPSAASFAPISVTGTRSRRNGGFGFRRSSRRTATAPTMPSVPGNACRTARARENDARGERGSVAVRSGPLA